MRYEEPNMEVILLCENNVLVTSSGLIVEENGGSSGNKWTEWF